MASTWSQDKLKWCPFSMPSSVATTYVEMGSPARSSVSFAQATAQPSKAMIRSAPSPLTFFDVATDSGKAIELAHAFLVQPLGGLIGELAHIGPAAAGEIEHVVTRAAALGRSFLRALRSAMF